MSPFTPQLRLHDRYVLRERIGFGGMSEVWSAEDEVLHRPVAVKALASSLAADPALRAVIQREARAAARLTHPHITQVYDYGEATLTGGAVVPYLVMELVQGRTLADRLTAGPLPWRDATTLGAQVAGALAAAHAIGVVHRDIKPGNVMLTTTGAKVLDFGIAALAGPGHSGDTGPLMGTPAYTAPERLAAGPPDPASDVYALGVLLYGSLTGRLPLPAETWADAIAAQRAGTRVAPLDVPGLPGRSAALVLACLATDPAGRPSADELAHRLGDAPRQDPPTALLPTVPTARQSPTLIDRTPPPARQPAPTVHQSSAPFDRTPPTAPYDGGSSAGPGRNRTPLLVGGLLAAGVALVVAIAAIAGGGDPDSGTPGAGAPATSVPAETAADPAPTTARPVPRTPQEALDAFAATVNEAESAGDIDSRVAEGLRRRVADIREKLGDRKRKELRKKVAELRKELSEAVEDDLIPARTGQQLQALLAPFNSADTADTDD